MTDDINFLTETLEFLYDNGKRVGDVLWIGNCGKSTTWEEFERMADFEYCNESDCNYIHSDLIIVGNDWWLERDVCDDSEGWVFRELPVRKKLSEFLEKDLICLSCRNKK